MLSEQDRRALDEIERHIAVDDPRFAATMRLTQPTGTDRWLGHAYDVLIVLGVLTTALCFALQLIYPGAITIAMVGVAYHLRPARSPAPPGPRRHTG